MRNCALQWLHRPGHPTLDNCFATPDLMGDVEWRGKSLFLCKSIISPCIWFFEQFSIFTTERRRRETTTAGEIIASISKRVMAHLALCLFASHSSKDLTQKKVSISVVLSIYKWWSFCAFFLFSVAASCKGRETETETQNKSISIQLIPNESRERLFMKVFRDFVVSRLFSLAFSCHLFLISNVSSAVVRQSFFALLDWVITRKDGRSSMLQAHPNVISISNNAATPDNWPIREKPNRNRSTTWTLLRRA